MQRFTDAKEGAPECSEDGAAATVSRGSGKTAEGIVEEAESEPLLQLPWKEFDVDWAHSGLTIGSNLLRINEVRRKGLLAFHCKGEG